VQTVVVGNGEPTGRALLWRAVWETGAGSVLDGVSALVASGLTMYEPWVISVVLREERVLRVPVLGLRLVPDQFMAQVVEAHRLLSAAAA